MRTLWGVALSAKLLLTTTLLEIVALYAGFSFSSATAVRLAFGFSSVVALFVVGKFLIHLHV